MAKKEKTTEELIMDLATKLKPVFKKDLFIKDSLYILPGQYTDDELCGDMFCMMEIPYKFAVEEYFGNSDLIYIDDIVEFKKEPENHTFKYTNNDIHYKELERKLNRIKKRLDEVETWEDFTKSFAEEFFTMFDNNSSVDLSFDEYPAITVAKKMFPNVTIKNANNLFFSILTLKEDELYDFCVEFKFTHFRIFMIYHYLKLED